MPNNLIADLKTRLLGKEWKSSDEKFLSLTLNDLRVIKPGIGYTLDIVSNRINIVIDHDGKVKDIFEG